jgi:hypothetical protein
MRLKIMAALSVLSPDAQLEFTRLNRLVRHRRHWRPSPDVGEGRHVAIEKLFVGKKPQTRAKRRRPGAPPFTEHISYPREILDRGAPP